MAFCPSHADQAALIVAHVARDGVPLAADLLPAHRQLLRRAANCQDCTDLQDLLDCRTYLPRPSNRISLEAFLDQTV